MNKAALALWTALALTLALTSALSGCVLAVPAELEPAAGPASATPAPLYQLSVNTVTWKVSASLPDGRVCRGVLEMLSRDDPSKGSMQSDWDRLYGPGFFAREVLGKVRGHATLMGDQGVCMHLELANPTLQDTGATQPSAMIAVDNTLVDVNGIARDEQGHLFKVRFRGPQHIDPA